MKDKRLKFKKAVFFQKDAAIFPSESMKIEILAPWLGEFPDGSRWISERQSVPAILIFVRDVVGLTKLSDCDGVKLEYGLDGNKIVWEGPVIGAEFNWSLSRVDESSRKAIGEESGILLCESSGFRELWLLPKFQMPLYEGEGELLRDRKLYEKVVSFREELEALAQVCRRVFTVLYLNRWDINAGYYKSYSQVGPVQSLLDRMHQDYDQMLLLVSKLVFESESSFSSFSSSLLSANNLSVNQKKYCKKLLGVYDVSSSIFRWCEELDIVASKSVVKKPLLSFKRNKRVAHNDKWADRLVPSEVEIERDLQEVIYVLRLFDNIVHSLGRFLFLSDPFHRVERVPLCATRLFDKDLVWSFWEGLSYQTEMSKLHHVSLGIT